MSARENGNPSLTDGTPFLSNMQQLEGYRLRTYLKQKAVKITVISVYKDTPNMSFDIVIG